MAPNSLCFLVFLSIFVASSFDAVQATDGKDYEIMLIEKLTKDYKKGARPVHSNKEAVVVYYDLKVNKLEKLITVNQLLILHTFAMIVWHDPHLKWNMTDFNGTDIITLDNALIWTPDIMLYNTAEADNKSPSDTYKAPVNVFPNGTVVWYVPVVWKSTCTVDITWFPVDTQICQLVFASLSYTKSRLRLLFHDHPMEFHDSKGHHHVTNGEWEYKGMKAYYKQTHYDCCHEPVEQIVYEITIKRKPLFFLLYMIFPVCAVVFLSLLGFIIPPESGERVGFGVTILLTMGVYLMVISEDLPKTAHSAPLIGVLYVTLFYVMILGYVASTISVNFSLRESKPPKFLLRLARKQKLPQRQNTLSIMRLRKPSTWSQDGLRSIREETGSEIGYGEDDARQQFEGSNHNSNDWLSMKEMKHENEKLKKEKKNDVQGYLSLHRESSAAGLLQAEKNNEDWRRIAAYLDKVFLILFLILIVVSCATILVALEIMHG